MKEKIYCMKCGIVLVAGLFGFGGDKLVEFKEGFLCENCFSRKRQEERLQNKV